MEIFNFIASQMGSAVARTGNIQDAQDLLQDIYELVWRKRLYFESKPIEEQKAIVYVCIRNRWIDLFRIANNIRRKPRELTRLRYTKPSVYSLLDLKDLIKTFEERNLQTILDYIAGYPLEDIITRRNETRGSGRTITQAVSVYSLLWRERLRLKNSKARHI